MNIPRRPAGLLLVGALAALAADRPGRVCAADDDGTIRGVAQGADGPAADAEIAAGIIGWAPAAEDRIAVTQADREGKFELKGAPLGPIDVWTRPKGGKWTFVIRMSNP